MRPSHPRPAPPSIERPAFRSGFALPLAILALVVVGLVLTAGIHLTLRGPSAPPPAARATEAFYLAETGVNTILAEWRPPSGGLQVWGPPDLQVGTTGQGRWEAEIRRVGEDLFFIRSTGVAGESENGSAARRTIGTAARLRPVDIRPGSPLEAMDGGETSGAGFVNREDVDPSTWGSRFCDASEDQESYGATSVGGRSARQARDSPQEALDTAPLRPVDDVDGIVAAGWGRTVELADVALEGGRIDHVAPVNDRDACDVGDPLNWGDPRAPESPCGSYFPIVHVRGDLELGGDGAGQGVLIVDGSLTVRDSFEFFGLVLVRDAFVMEGGPSGGPAIFGSVRVYDSTSGAVRLSGFTRVQYSHCAVGRAILNNDRLRRLRAVSDRAWVDLVGASL